MEFEAREHLFYSLSLSLSLTHTHIYTPQQVPHTKATNNKNIHDSHERFDHDEIEDPEHISFMNLPSHTHHRTRQENIHKHDEINFTTLENHMEILSSEEEHEHHEISYPSPSHVTQKKENKLSHHYNITFTKMEQEENKIDHLKHHSRDKIPGISRVHILSPSHNKINHVSHHLPSKELAESHERTIPDDPVEHDNISYHNAPSPSHNRMNRHNDSSISPHDIPDFFQFGNDAKQADVIASYPHARDLTYVSYLSLSTFPPTHTHTQICSSRRTHTHTYTDTIITYTITHQAQNKNVEKQQKNIIFTIQQITLSCEITKLKVLFL